jgi:hypothetical protein
MNFVHIRFVAAASLLSLLTACGGSDFEAATQAAQAAAPASAVTEASVAATAQATPGGPGGQNPVPDCEADKCQGLRIIDGNAEAYRFDAMRRSAAEAGGAS